MIPMRLLLSFLVLIAVGVSTLAVAEDRDVPAMLDRYGCSTCHGDRGQGNGQFPRVAYQHSDYVIKQLTVFQRTNERPDGVAMKAITHSLSDQNMAAVAAYMQQMPSK